MDNKRRVALIAALESIPCAWCGQAGTREGFYHVVCARKMADTNMDQYRQPLMTAQKRLRAIYRALVTPTGHLDQEVQHSEAMRSIGVLQRITRRCLTAHRKR